MCSRGLKYVMQKVKLKSYKKKRAILCETKKK